MLKYEFKKFILKPSVIIVAIIFIMLNFVKFFEMYFYFGGGRGAFSGPDLVKQGENILNQKYGGEITTEKINELQSELQEAKAKRAEYNPDLAPFEDCYCGSPFADMVVLQSILENYEYAITYPDKSKKIAESALLNADFFDNKNAFEIQKNKLIYESYRDRAVNTYVVQEGYTKLFSYKFSSILFMLFIIFVLSPIFSFESANGFDRLIISSGKRLKAIKSKLILVAFTGTMSAVAFFVADFIFATMFYGMNNSDAPIYALRAYSDCPFELTLLGGIVSALFGRIIFSLFFSAIIAFISSLNRNIGLSLIFSVGAGAGIVLLSDILPDFFNPASLSFLDCYFTDFKAVNILGYPFFSVIINALLTLIFTVLLFIFSIISALKNTEKASSTAIKVRNFNSKSYDKSKNTNTVFGFEIKKLYTKQFVFILTLILVVIKLFTSADIFKKDYGNLTPEAREVYLSYIEKYGGQLDSEKETAILKLHAELLDAVALEQEIYNKLRLGEYTTSEEYLSAIKDLPQILNDKAAIEKLYNSYLTAKDDRENRLILASDAPSMTTGMDYLLLCFICFITASDVYYEQKMTPVLKTTKKGGKYSARYKLATLALGVFIPFLCFAIIDFAALITVIGGDVTASLASLESFAHTPYSQLNILSAFLLIQLTKLLGYFALSAFTLILITATKNFPLSLFLPIALNIIWVYLLSDNTAAFYMPFSLMRGFPYFTGDYYSYGFLIYNAVPLRDFIIMVILDVLIIAFGTAFYIMSQRNYIIKRTINKPLSIIMSVILCFTLCGCSEDKQSDNIMTTSNYEYAENSKFIFIENDNKISMYDKNKNLIYDKINREIFPEFIGTKGLFATENYLYYMKNDFDEYYIARISLSDFKEEQVYYADCRPFATGSTKYMDMITVFCDTDQSSIIPQFFAVSADDSKIILCMQNFTVYELDIKSGSMRYLFEEGRIDNLCFDGEKLYYTNKNGVLNCYDKEKQNVSDRIFSCFASDNTGIYCGNADGLFKYDFDTLKETKISDFSIKNNIKIGGDKIIIECNDRKYRLIDKNGLLIREVESIFDSYDKYYLDTLF